MVIVSEAWSMHVLQGGGRAARVRAALVAGNDYFLFTVSFRLMMWMCEWVGN